MDIVLLDWLDRLPSLELTLQNEPKKSSPFWTSNDEASLSTSYFVKKA